MGKLGGQEGLSYASDDAGFKHGADPQQDCVQRNARLAGYDVKGLLLEPFDEVFRDREDLRVCRVIMLSRNAHVVKRIGCGRRIFCWA